MLKFLLFILVVIGSISISTKRHPVPPRSLQKRTSGTDCMDPNSQPELFVSFDISTRGGHKKLTLPFWINDACPASLTSPSRCLDNSAYKQNCVAYCEQFLYWFFGSEVPYPNSHCEANETCTFSTADTFAIMNSYTFAGGITATTGIGALKLAFNLGATYTYSTTITTSQTVTSTRPENSSDSCGYWTFLPYFVMQASQTA